MRTRKEIDWGSDIPGTDLWAEWKRDLSSKLTLVLGQQRIRPETLQESEAFTG